MYHIQALCGSEFSPPLTNKEPIIEEIPTGKTRGEHD